MACETKPTETEIARRVVNGVIDCAMVAVLDLMLLFGLIPQSGPACIAAVFAGGFGTIIFPYCLWRDAKSFQGLQDQEEGE